MFDLNLVPDIKSVLVTHAYRTFFDRTLANFEALVEGRDIRIGRPVDEPATVTAEQIMQLLGRVGEIAAPLLQHLTNLPRRPKPRSIVRSMLTVSSMFGRQRNHSRPQQRPCPTLIAGS